MPKPAALLLTLTTALLVAVLARSQQPTPAPTAISPVAATVLGRDGDPLDLKARIKAAQALGNNLQPAEIEALYAFMDRKAGEDSLPVSKLAVVKNDVANAMLNQTNPPRKFGQRLLVMFADKTHDTLWRDFCAQFMGRWYARADAEERTTIRDTFWQATAETDSSIGGTALIALRDNVGQGDIDKDRLTRRAYELAADPTTGEPVRVTALQVCAALGHAPALTLAREIVNGTEGACLRMSAIAAIGMLGDTSDIPAIEELTKNPDVRLRNAANSARDRLAKTR